MKAMMERLMQTRKRWADDTLVSPWNSRVSDDGQVEGLLTQQRERSRVGKKQEAYSLDQADMSRIASRMLYLLGAANGSRASPPDAEQRRPDSLV